MGPAARARSGWWPVLGLLVALPALGQSRRVELCLTAKGFADPVVAETRQLVASLIQPFGVFLGAPECCFADECLQVAQRERGLAGVVGLELLRFGPMVRINVRVFDLRRGGEILIRKSRATAKGFPGSAGSLARDLGEAFQALDLGKADAADDSDKSKGPVAGPEPSSQRRPGEDPEGLSEPRGGAAGSGPKSIVSMGPNPGMMSGGSIEAIAERRTTMHWVGGSLLAGGGLALAAGIGLLAGPMLSALDERNWARDAWLASTEPDAIERYRSQMMAQDDEAKRYYLAGWITTGLGAGLAVAGILTLLLTPDLPLDAPLAAAPVRPQVRPTLGPNGDGLMFRLDW
jgi:hypothetical protein